MKKCLCQLQNQIWWSVWRNNWPTNLPAASSSTSRFQLCLAVTLGAALINNMLTLGRKRLDFIFSNSWEVRRWWEELSGSQLTVTLPALTQHMTDTTLDSCHQQRLRKPFLTDRIFTFEIWNTFQNIFPRFLNLLLVSNLYSVDFSEKWRRKFCTENKVWTENGNSGTEIFALFHTELSVHWQDCYCLAFFYISHENQWHWESFTEKRQI